MVLHQSAFATPDRIMKSLVKILNKREDEWSKEQNRLLKLKIEEKIELAKKQSKYVNKLLVMCKSWGGPVVSIPELESVLNRHHDKSETIVKNELAYYKHTHRAEVIASPRLYRLIKISHEERLSNLMVILSQQAIEVSCYYSMISHHCIALPREKQYNDTTRQYSGHKFHFFPHPQDYVNPISFRICWALRTNFERFPAFLEEKIIILWGKCK